MSTLFLVNEASLQCTFQGISLFFLIVQTEEEGAIGFQETGTVEQVIPVHINRVASLAFNPANYWPYWNPSQSIHQASEKKVS